MSTNLINSNYSLNNSNLPQSVLNHRTPQEIHFLLQNILSNNNEIRKNSEDYFNSILNSQNPLEEFGLLINLLSTFNGFLLQIGLESFKSYENTNINFNLNEYLTKEKFVNSIQLLLVLLSKVINLSSKNRCLKIFFENQTQNQGFIVLICSLKGSRAILNLICSIFEQLCLLYSEWFYLDGFIHYLYNNYLTAKQANSVEEIKNNLYIIYKLLETSENLRNDSSYVLCLNGVVATTHSSQETDSKKFEVKNKEEFSKIIQNLISDTETIKKVYITSLQNKEVYYFS